MENTFFMDFYLFQDFHIQNIFRKEFYRVGESIPERQGKDRDPSYGKADLIVCHI